MIKQEILPPVTISTGDYDRLAFLATFGLNFQQDRPAAAMLANELIRATVVTPRTIPPTVATMHSRLEFRDDVT
jgi:regulator of nucleoside diphosphate kinase